MSRQRFATANIKYHHVDAEVDFFHFIDHEFNRVRIFRSGCEIENRATIYDAVDNHIDSTSRIKNSWLHVCRGFTEWNVLTACHSSCYFGLDTPSNYRRQSWYGDRVSRFTPFRVAIKIGSSEICSSLFHLGSKCTWMRSFLSAEFQVWIYIWVIWIFD